MALSGTSDYGFSSGHILRIEWSGTQNVAGNYTTVTTTVKLYRNYNWNSSASKNGSITINGNTWNFSCTVGGSGWKDLYTVTTNIGHASNGTQSLQINATCNVDVTLSGIHYGAQTVSGSWDLNTIPRGTAWTNLELISNDWTSITFKFSAADACDSIWIHKNGGGRIGTGLQNVSNGTFTVPDLVPNTQFTWQLEVVRNGVSTWSKTLVCNTKLACTGISLSTSSSWNPDSPLTITFKNPDKCDLRIYLYVTAPNEDGEQQETGNLITKYIGAVESYEWVLTEEESNRIYEKLKYSNVASAKLYANNSVPGTTTYMGGNVTPFQISIDSNLYAPSISTFDITVDSTTSSILGDSPYLIQNISAITATVNKSNIVIGKGADLKTVTFKYGGYSQDFNGKSDITIFEKVISNFFMTGNYPIQVYITDTRGNKSNVLTKDYTVLSYRPPIITASVSKELSTDGKIDVSFTASYSRLLMKDIEKNSINIKYGYEVLGSPPEADTVIPPTDYSIVPAENGVDNIINFNKIDMMTLDSEKNYQFIFVIQDSLKATTITVDVVDGNPIMRILETGQVGINCKPDTSNIDEKLRVNGDAYVSGSIKVAGNLNFTDTEADTNYSYKFGTSDDNGWIHRIGSDGVIDSLWEFRANGDFFSGGDVITSTGISLVNTHNSLPEYGENDTWCYRKWSNGIAECWTKSPVVFENQSITTESWAGGYESPRITLPDFPFVFTTIPFANISIAGMDGRNFGDYMIIYCGQISNDANSFKRPQDFKLWRGTTKILGHPCINCYAIGKWK